MAARAGRPGVAKSLQCRYVEPGASTRPRGRPSATGRSSAAHRPPAQHHAGPVARPLPVVDETSAGGIVVSRREGVDHAAVIARRNRAGRLEWCLPKGHLEGDETPEEAAVREIAEETGITGQVLRRLGVIDYWFSGDDRRVHKVVHHFLLGATGGFLTVEGDPDGEAEDAAWIPVAELNGVLAYPNERRLAEAALVVLVGEE